MTKLREFTEHDWDAWAGAESPSGSEPLIAEMSVTDWPEVEKYKEWDVECGTVTIIVDATCVGITGIDVWLSYECPYEMGRVIANGILGMESVSYTDLRAMGFV